MWCNTRRNMMVKHKETRFLNYLFYLNLFNWMYASMSCHVRLRCVSVSHSFIEHLGQQHSSIFDRGVARWMTHNFHFYTSFFMRFIFFDKYSARTLCVGTPISLHNSKGQSQGQRTIRWYDASTVLLAMCLLEIRSPTQQANYLVLQQRNIISTYQVGL